jgi:hypothetical protein
MNKPVFSIVIPTRNRCDVLRSAVATAVAQTDDTVQVLVSDNASADETRQVVESFQDSRVRYVNPGSALGMSEHWEFALSHVTPGFVTVLGDDDGLLPDAVQRARAAIETFDVQAITWRKAEYHWPDHIIPSFRDWLQIPFGNISVFDAYSILRDVLAFRRTYTDLPCVYNSFVSTDLLRAVEKKGNGTLFPCVTPDVYSGLAIACIVKKYVFSGIPLSVNAASRHSNGTLASFRGIRAGGPADHFASTSRQVHPRLVPSSSVPVLIADAFLCASERFAPEGGWPDFDWRAMFELAARYAEDRPSAVLEETVRGLDEIAARNNLMELWEPIRHAIAQREAPMLQPFGWNPEGTCLAANGKELGLFNVADAALFTASVLCALSAKQRWGRLLTLRRPSCLPEGLDPARQERWSNFIHGLRVPQPPSLSKRYWYAGLRRIKRIVHKGRGRAPFG